MAENKSKKDIETNNDKQYCFNETFNTLDDVLEYLENNQDVVNNFFIERFNFF